MNGKNKKRIAKGKLLYSDSSIDLEYGYGNKVYFVTELDPGTLKVVNVKTKKIKRLAKNVTSTTRSGNYLYLDPYSGDAYGGQPLRFYPQKMIKLKQSPNVQIIRSAEKLYIIQTIKNSQKRLSCRCHPL